MRVEESSLPLLGYPGWFYLDRSRFVFNEESGVVRMSRFRVHNPEDESQMGFYDERGDEVGFNVIEDLVLHKKTHTVEGLEIGDPSEDVVEVLGGGAGVPVDLVAQVVQVLSQQAEQAGGETFEDSLDFEEDDDLPGTKHELVAMRSDLVAEALRADEKLRRMNGGRSKGVTDAEGKVRDKSGGNGDVTGSGDNSSGSDGSHGKSSESPVDKASDKS